MSNTEQLRNTSLTDVHIALGGKMVPFAGYNMPVQYSNLREEHMAVRNSVGMFDVSHMGEFAVEGEGATPLLEWITSNDVGKLVDMQAQYSCLPNETGGIVDDLIIYKWSNNEYSVVVNASNIEKDWNWIVRQNEEKGFGAVLRNMSDDLSLLAVQGPNATKTIQKLTDVDLSTIEFYHFAGGSVGGIEDIVISNTGYTGSGGFELYVWNKDAKKLWDAVMEAGEEYGILPCGLGCRDTLRLEKGFCLYGNDINDETSPIEAGLGWITKFDKPFVNMEHHAKIKAEKTARRLVAFEMIDRGIPRQHYTINNADGSSIGEVTSGTQSPSLGKAIGMGYVKREWSKLGSDIYIEIRGKSIKASIVKLPFL
jgi:glycine cleavage system T protein (aminomethyltransferase)